jgi:hypothetical protein
MRNKILLLTLIGGMAALALSSISCKTPHLEAGGSYAPTNAQGQVIYNDVGLALADASYKYAYNQIFDVMKFERENRKTIYAISPTGELNFKHALDRLRPMVVEIDKRWAFARRAYRLNPTPAGLNDLQTALAEIQRFVPVVQSQLVPINSLQKPNP